MDLHTSSVLGFQNAHHQANSRGLKMRESGVRPSPSRQASYQRACRAISGTDREESAGMTRSKRSTCSHGTEAREGVRLQFRGIAVQIAGRDILVDVAGTVEPGELLAVMGPSGSGKTTLLNVLSGRVAPEHLKAGEILINGGPITKRIKRKICYVLQQDIFLGNLTLRETLMFAAMLRLSDRMPHHEKVRKVNDIVLALDIGKCLDTVVGDGFSVKGLSGGEKKRANIACELLTDPSLMLLDEPTSGLDSSTAYSLMTTVKQYTEQHNKTVVTTIHQPSSQIYHMFDKLLLMADGEVAYFGDSQKVMDFFSSLGMQPELNYNPADFILEKVKESDTVTRSIIEASNETRRKSQMAPLSVEQRAYPCTAEELYWKDFQGAFLDEEIDQDKDPKWPTSFFTQYKVLTRRNMKEAKPRIISKLHWIQHLALSAVLSVLWFQIPRVETSLWEISGGFFFLATYWASIPMLDALLCFPAEALVVNKERLAGMYRLSAYYLAKATSEAPMIVLYPTIMMSLFYPMCGLGDFGGFVALWSLLVLNCLVGQSIGFFLSTVFQDFRQGLMSESVLFLANLLLGGYMNANIPHWLRWFRYTTFINYSYQAMVTAHFTEDRPYRCAPDQSVFQSCSRNVTTSVVSNSSVSLSNTSQPAYIHYQEILQFQGVDNPMWLNVAALVLMMIGFRYAGYLVLRYLRKPK